MLLEEATIPAVFGGGEGLTLAAAIGAERLDPSVTVFTAVAGERVIATAAIDETALPAELGAASLALRHEITSAPDGAFLSLEATGADGDSRPWAAGEPLALLETTALTWAFDQPGRYSVHVSAIAELAPSTSGADPAAAEAVADYVIEVSAPDDSPEVSADASPGSDEPVTGDTGVAGGATVVSEGDVRVVSSLRDGALVQELASISGDGARTTFDPASVVLALPEPEAWPGLNDGEDPDVWAQLAPSRGDVYRTSAEGIGASSLSLSLDAGELLAEEVFGGIFDDRGGVYTRLGSVDGPDTSGLLAWGSQLVGTSIRAGDAAEWMETSPHREFGFYPSQQPVSAAFTAPGRYCLTLQTMMQRGDEGTVVNNDITLTFAVGGVDASHVQPCAQADAIPAHAPRPTPAPEGDVTVIEYGVALLGSTLQGEDLSLNVVTTDRGRTTSYDPERVVFSVPNRDTRWPWDGKNPTGTSQHLWEQIAPPGTKLYRTPGTYSNATDERANDLVIDADARFIPAEDLAPDAAVTYRFRGASTNGAGYVATYRQDGPEASLELDRTAFWDSRDGGRREDLTAPSVSEWGDPFYIPTTSFENAPALGFAFSDAGVYCVSVVSATTLADGTAAEDISTFTFAVGVDASGVTPCAQDGGDDPGTGGPGNGGEPEQLDPTVSWMQRGHVDLALTQNEQGELQFATGDTSRMGMIPLHDSVWVGRGPFATFTVPEPDALQERTFLGEPGASYYGFTGSGEFLSQTLWPGLSMLHIPEEPGAPYTNRQATWTFHKVSGPGDVVVWSPSNVYLNSKTNTSQTFSLSHTHVHQNWAFTQAGVYCLGVHARLRIAADETGDRTTAGLLTVVVGDVDLSTVQPCERDQEPPASPAPAPLTVSDESAIIGAENVTRVVELTDASGRPEVVAASSRTVGDPLDYRDVEKAVFPLPATGDRWTGPSILWRTFLHAPGNGEVTLSLGEVEGPGEFFAEGMLLDRSSYLDTRVGRGRTSATLWSGHQFDARHAVTVAGVYCVPLTWSGRTVDGKSFSVAKTLTFTAGVDDPAAVKRCADGGEGTDPGEDPEPESPVQWEVPNGTRTDSGATIVNVGHVDVASVLSGRTLDTLIHDQSGAGEGIDRRPEQTVLQVTPIAERTVPAADAFRFLGGEGDPVWLLPETQDEALLWPGWSTERIPASATSRGFDWTLTRTSGPGEFVLYGSDSFGTPQIRFNTRDGMPDATQIPPLTHAHGAWAFTAEGVYCLDFTRATTLSGGQEASDEFVLTVAVGAVDVKRIDPAKCFTEPDTAPHDPDTTPIPVRDLSEDNAGVIQVLDGAAGFSAGQLVTAQIGAAHSGEWVSIWFDDTDWLGWVRVGSSGAAQVRLPASASPGPHVLVVQNRDGSLAGWDSLSVVSGDGGSGPGDPGGEEPLPDAVWDVSNGTVNGKGAIVLNNGHVDIASLLDNGALQTRIKDSATGVEPVMRDVERTLLQLLPNSRSVVPAGEAWSFLGSAGAGFYQISQTQQAGLLWPGWSTEAIPLSATTGGVAWALTDVSGPGEFALYETANFGQPRVLFNTRDGISSADRVTIPKNTHAHGSWAFSEQGNYCLSMQRTARMPGGQAVSHSFVLAVAVGTADVMQIDPARCDETVDTTPVVVDPPGSEGPGDGTPAAQHVAATQCVAGATILSAGHIDYASRIVGGRLQSLIGDDTSGSKVYREPAGTVLWLKPSSRVTLPSGFGQVGPAGSTVWQVPQTQNANLIWLGWNTESLHAGNARSAVQWTVNSVEGPGSVKVYLSGAFGGVQQMIFDGGGSHDIPLGVHAHANWAFGAEGVYRITTTQTATLANGQTSSDRETLTIVVGDVDPATATGGGSGCGTVSNALLLSDDADAALQAAEQASADAAAAARDRLPGDGSDTDARGFDPFAALANGNPVPLLLSILGALLLLGAAGTGALWWRRHRALRAEHIRPDRPERGEM